MSYESLYSLEHSINFRENFQDSYSVQANKYAKGIISSTGIKFENGVAKFNGTSGKIIYKRVNGYSIRFKLKPIINNQQILRLSSTQSISINNLNQITASGLTSPNYYVNGQLKQTINLNNWNEIIITTSTKFKCIDFQIGFNNTFYKGDIEFFEIYNKTISATEAKLLFQQQLYSQPPSLKLLLDYQSTRNIIEDLTGNNNLIVNNTPILKIGGTYSAYFNKGNGINLICPFKYTDNIVINMWINTKSINSSKISDPLYSSTHFIQFINNSIYFYGDGSTQILLLSNINIYTKMLNIIIFLKSTEIIGAANGILGTPKNITRTAIIGNLYIGYPNGAFNYVNGFIPKLQIYQGISNKPDNFAAQKFNSERGMFGV